MTKKKKKNKQDFYKPSKWLYILLFGLPLLLTLFYVKTLDNDIWYLLSEGRYIIENGIYYVDPLSIHKGLEVTVQNWLSASIFYLVFEAFGEMGLLTMMLVCNFFICLLLYKICMTISEKNTVLSLMIMFICDSILTAHFIVSRPQIFSFIVLLGLIYALELYIKTDNKKYLIWLPILSLIEANLHASLWWMLFLFTLPYVIDSFGIKIFKTQGYRKKPLLIAIGIALLVGLINPYGYKAITFIFTSYGDKYMHLYISELLPYRFANTLSKHIFALFLAVMLCYAFFREGHIRVRYLCLFSGTLLLGFMSIKGFSHFILVSLFPLAYFFKDIFPRDFSELDGLAQKIINTTTIVLCIGLFGIFGFTYISKINTFKLAHEADGAIEVLKRFNNKKSIVYSSFNNGGYVEFHGFKPYIDPRAEVFLKINNKKKDIFEENYKLQHGYLDLNKFIKDYNFTHLLIQENDILYNKMEEIENYFVLYENTDVGYRLYARYDQLPDEEREKIIAEYTAAIDKAKEDAEDKNKDTENN